MRVVFKTLLDISLLSGRPQDLPASNSLLALILVSALVVNYFVDAAHIAVTTRFQFALAEIVLLGFTTWVVLAIRQRPHRWRQTVIALYGSSTVVNIATWPIVAWLMQAQAASAVLLLGLVVTAWFIAIMARILHFALDLSLSISVLISVVALLVNGTILLSLFPPNQL